MKNPPSEPRLFFSSNFSSWRACAYDRCYVWFHPSISIASAFTGVLQFPKTPWRISSRTLRFQLPLFQLVAWLSCHRLLALRECATRDERWCGWCGGKLEATLHGALSQQFAQGAQLAYDLISGTLPPGTKISDFMIPSHQWLYEGLLIILWILWEEMYFYEIGNMYE